MKSRTIIIAGLILVFSCVTGTRAQNDTDLKARVETLYEKTKHALEEKSLEALLSLFADDYETIGFGVDRQGIRSIFGVRFGYDRLRAEYKILDITRSGDMIQVASDQKLEGKSGDRDWRVITQNTVLDLLIPEGDSLKFFRSTETDKFRLKYVRGQTYRDEQTGFSFTAPENWRIFPSTAQPIIQGLVFVLAPDKTSAAMLGYVKIHGISSKKAAEGDEAAGKILSYPETYKLIKSGPTVIAGHEGFEIESEFLVLAEGRERHRRRVYFYADGLLFLLTFDAVPFKQWDTVKDGFQTILDSIKIEN